MTGSEATAMPRRGTLPGRRARSRVALAPYLFVSPFYILFLLFLLVPIGIGIYLSLTDWAGLGNPDFVGFQNYVRLAGDGSFLGSLANTGIYTVFVLIVVLPLALLIASGLNARGLRFRDFFRTLYFVPVVLSPVIIALVFGLIFDGRFGILNAVLNALFGTPSVSWLTDDVLAKGVVMTLVVWRWVGYLAMFFLAGMQGIPAEQYEAAELDGAGAIRRFLSVTLPNLRPITAFLIVTMLIATAQIFDEPYLLTQGGPGEATLSVSMFIYRAAFQRQQLGYAAAAGVVMFILVFALGRFANAVVGIGREDS